MPRVLVFSPYFRWSHVYTYEGTIAKACQVRGAQVEYILCDGIMPECDIHWDSYNEDYHFRPFNLCQSYCLPRAKTGIEKLNIPYRWLSDLVKKEEREHAFSWAQSLTASEMCQAFYKDYPVGEWVMSSMSSYFRQYPPEMNRWHVVGVYRSFLYSAALTVIGLRNYLGKFNVDAAILYNARLSVTRVALEIFRMKGLRVLTHETPFYKRGHLNIRPNTNCWSLTPFKEFWKIWGKIPLTRHSLENTLTWLKDRRYAKNLTWFPFNNPFLSNTSIKKHLNLSGNKRLLALFTSSTDETGSDPEWQGPFESQASWVQGVVDWVKDRNDVELVIRTHPFLSGKFGLGKASDEFDFYRKMKENLPENVRMIMPDDSLNSYALMEEADIGLTYNSTIGFEMAMLGKPIVLGARGFYEDGFHILPVRSKESLKETLEESLKPFSAREIRREAFRLAYYYVFEFEPPFPLVSMLDVLEFKMNYSTPTMLESGKDKGLDNISNYLLEGSPLYRLPTKEEQSRTHVDEDEFFKWIEQSSDYLRDFSFERFLKRLNWFKRLGGKTKAVLEQMPLGTGNALIRAGRAVYRPVMKWVVKR